MRSSRSVSHRVLAGGYRAARFLGVDPRQGARSLRDLPRLRAQRQLWMEQRKGSALSQDFPEGRKWLIPGEDAEPAGSAKGHYFHQDLLVASEICRRNPDRHIDVGSSVYGFVSHVASFREIEVLDIRDLSTPWPNIRFTQVDLMDRQAVAQIRPADSVSCLHALEHFGLGRYGDPVNFDGWKQGLTALSHLVSPGGVLYLSVPTSFRQRIEFNAHRVFSIPFLAGHLSNDFTVLELAFVDDAGDLHRGLDLNSAEAQRSFDAEYGLSIWLLERRA